MSERSSEWGSAPLGPQLEAELSTPLVEIRADGYDVFVGDPPLIVGHSSSCKWTRAGGGFVLPDRFIAIVADDRYPAMVLHFAVETGDVVCRRLDMVARPGRPPLTPTNIRVPLVRLRRDAATVAAARVVEVREGGSVLLRRVQTGEEGEAFLEAWTPQRRGVPLEDEKLRQVAEVYRRGGRTPTAAVAKELFLARSTAGRWVAEARRRGYLGAAEPRRAGELKAGNRPKKKREK